MLTPATAGGFIAGGVLLGVTGGLAAPALIALLAPLGLGAALSGMAAPVVLGTLFGLTGGGLASRRVSQRWRGVDEFRFVEVGANSKPTKEEVEDLKAREGKDKSKEDERVESELLFEAPSDDDAAAAREVARSRRELEERLNELSLGAKLKEKEVARTPPDTPKDVVKELKEKHPSLTATVVVPGLLNVSRMEAIAAWRAICSRELPLAFSPRDGKGSKTPEPASEGGEGATTGMKDGRDVYVLRYETETMLSCGREIESWGELIRDLRGADSSHDQGQDDGGDAGDQDDCPERILCGCRSPSVRLNSCQLLMPARCSSSRPWRSTTAGWVLRTRRSKPVASSGKC